MYFQIKFKLDTPEICFVSKQNYSIKRWINFDGLTSTVDFELTHRIHHANNDQLLDVLDFVKSKVIYKVNEQNFQLLSTVNTYFNSGDIFFRIYCFFLLTVLATWSNVNVSQILLIVHRINCSIFDNKFGLFANVTQALLIDDWLPGFCFHFIWILIDGS